MQPLRQGDVLLIKVDKLPKDAQALKSPENILQMSEVTGHHHHFAPTALVDMYTSKRDISVIDKGTFSTITPDEGKYIVLKEDAELYHGKGYDPNPQLKGTGDHKSFKVPAGTYRIDIIREYDYDRNEVTRVID